MEIFGGEILHMSKFGDMPPNPEFPISDDIKDNVLHCSINILGSVIMLSDSFNVQNSGNNMYISISANETVVLKAWSELKKGGNVINDITPTFFAKQHGSLKDKFGINWMFTAEL